MLSNPLNSFYYYDSGAIPLYIEAGPQGIVAISYRSGKTCDHGYDFKPLIFQLNSYFSGSLQRFSLPLAYDRTTFAGRVMTALLRVPYGRTLSYGALARNAGFPGAARAVGTVMAKNPLPILVPCHRVILSDGCLGRYSGGIGVKERLLRLERAVI
ncbi:MAG: methylated-DNA--[protein]-cysteine S-methyltransferase [Fibrobacterota bacterium]